MTWRDTFVYSEIQQNAACIKLNADVNSSRYVQYDVA